MTAASGRPGGRRVRESSITVDGVRTRVLEAGPGEDGEAVVFVHGNPGSAADWQRLVGAAGGVGRAIAIDMPAFGRAERPADFDYTVGGYAAFLESALRELGVERVHLVLHDFGGPFGIAWGLGRPEAFASAVLINTGVLIGYRWHTMARVWRTPVLGELSMAVTTRSAFRRVLGRGNPRGLPPEFVDRMYDDYDRGTRRAVLRLYRATPSDTGGAAAPAMRELDRPALVVWGQCDAYIPTEQAERQRESFPRAEIVMLPESGHFPFADDPDAVERAVLPFLARQLGSG